MGRWRRPVTGLMRPAAAALAGLVFAAGPLPVVGQRIDSLALRDHARVLADDSLLGRGTGTAGERAAAAYIARQLGRIGLDPLAGDGFLEPLALLRVELLAESRVAIRTEAGVRTFQAGDHFLVSGGLEALRAFHGPLVYLPPDSPVDPEVLRGRVVLTDALPGDGDANVLRGWIENGVEGVILPLDEAGFAAMRLRLEGRLIVDALVDDPIWQPGLPIIYAGPALVSALVAGAPPPQRPGAIPLDRAVTADLRFRTEPVPSANVSAVITGADPALRDELVLLTAHYDHLGVGPPIDGDSIYNGFSDNAAGVAMLLGIAEALADAPPARSVAFLFTSGEERGLLGATAWAARPPIPLSRITAVLNLDAGAPPAPPIRWRVAGDTTNPMLETAARVIEAQGWAADITGTRANSDHWPFIARGIPAAFLVPGREWEGLDDAARDRLFAQWDRYHHPGDEWRPDFPLAGLQRYAELALELVRALANGLQVM